MDLCDDGCPKNIFWAHRRSRDAYTKFGDAFYVTYIRNKLQRLVFHLSIFIRVYRMKTVII